MDEQQKLNEFEAATYDAWLKLAERDLQGAPFEKKLVKRISGVDVQPLYTRAQAPEESRRPARLQPIRARQPRARRGGDGLGRTPGDRTG